MHEFINSQLSEQRARKERNKNCMTIGLNSKFHDR